MCIYPQPKAARPIGGQAFRWAVPTDADGGPRRVERRASKKAEERHAKRHRTKPAGNACAPAPASFASPTHCGVRAEPVQRPESSTATAKRMYSSLRARPAHATVAQKNVAARQPGHGGRSLGLQLEAQGGASALRRHGTNVAPNNMAHISRSDVKKAYDDLFFASDDGDNTAGRPCRHRFLSAAASLLRPPASFPLSARGPSATDCAWRHLLHRSGPALAGELPLEVESEGKDFGGGRGAGGADSGISGAEEAAAGGEQHDRQDRLEAAVGALRQGQLRQ